MLIDVAGVRATDDDHIGLGLGHIVERERLVFTHVTPVAESCLQCPANATDDDRMATAFRLSDDEKTVEQLDGLVFLERTGRDHSVVSSPRHAPEPLQRRSCLSLGVQSCSRPHGLPGDGAAGAALKLPETSLYFSGKVGGVTWHAVSVRTTPTNGQCLKDDTPRRMVGSEGCPSISSATRW